MLDERSSNWRQLALLLFERIKHGDPQHQAWLRAELIRWADDMARLGLTVSELKLDEGQS